MRSRSAPAIVVALVLGLVLGGGAVAAINLPKHSVGWNKLTKGVQERILKAAATPVPVQGPRGPQGEPGAVGQPGAAGQQGSEGKQGNEPKGFVRYSAVMSKGDPDRVLATVGPLTFKASCSDDGGNTKGVLTATSSANGVWLVGNTLNQGDTVVLRELNGAIPLEDFFPIIRAVDTQQSFALQGVPMTAINTLGKDCRFWGSLFRDDLNA